MTFVFSDVTNDLAIAQAFMFFFAGMDATSLLMLYTAANLAQSKKCQAKAREEIKTVLQKYGGYSWEAVRDMKYLDSCVQGSYILKFNKYFSEMYIK